MNKRKSLKEKMNEPANPNPLDNFFKPSEKVETKVVRKTYYVTEELVNALRFYSTFEDINISEIVRNALNEYIPKEYIEKAKEKEERKNK